MIGFIENGVHAVSTDNEKNDGYSTSMPSDPPSTGTEGIFQRALSLWGSSLDH